MALTTTNGMSVDGLDAAPNGPGLAQQLGNQVDEFYGKSVANAAALPASGKFPGQRVWLVDVKGWGVWDGFKWVTDTGWVAPTLGSGWANVSYSSKFHRRSGRVTVILWAAKATFSEGDVVFQLPPGSRPSEVVPFGCVWSGAVRELRIDTNGNVAVQAASTAGVTGSVTFPVAI